MQQRAVAGGCLYSMTKGVAQVEGCTQPTLKLVSRDDLSLYNKTAIDSNSIQTAKVWWGEGEVPEKQTRGAGLFDGLAPSAVATPC